RPRAGVGGRGAALPAPRVSGAGQGGIRNPARRAGAPVGRWGGALDGRGERARTRLVRAGERLAAFRWDRQGAAHRERVRRDRDRLPPPARARPPGPRGALPPPPGEVGGRAPPAPASPRLPPPVPGRRRAP